MWLSLLSHVWKYLKTVISHRIVVLVELFALASHCQFPCAFNFFGMPFYHSRVQGAGPQNMPHCMGQAEGLRTGAGRIFCLPLKRIIETLMWEVPSLYLEEEHPDFLRHRSAERPVQALLGPQVTTLHPYPLPVVLPQKSQSSSDLAWKHSSFTISLDLHICMKTPVFHKTYIK